MPHTGMIARRTEIIAIRTYLDSSAISRRRSYWTISIVGTEALRQVRARMRGDECLNETYREISVVPSPMTITVLWWI